MKKKEWKVILEAQLPKSYQSDKSSTDDEQQQESSKTRPQPQSSRRAAPQSTQPIPLQKTSPAPSPPHDPSTTSTEPSKPTPHQGCASPEHRALFIEWPFKAPARGQTSMPPFITGLINNLSTREERLRAMQLWNRSLPIAANVGIIEYNRVDEVNFKERAKAKFGEGWSRRLEDLVTGLNGAAGVITGRLTSGEVAEGRGKELEGKAVDEGATEGKGPEMQTFGSSTGKGRESEIENPNDIVRKGKEAETKTLAQLAEAATLIETEEESKTKPVNSTNGESKKPQTTTSSSAIEAATRLPSPASNPPTTLIATNALSALWHLIDRFFSSGYPAASYIFVTLEASIRLSTTTVHPLHIPAPPSFWTSSTDWHVPKAGMTLLLTLASSEKTMFDALAYFSKSLGKRAPTASAMRTASPASLRKAILRAKDEAMKKQRTTVLGVNLRDVLHAQLCEVHGKRIEAHFATFARMFVLGVCPEGAKLWLVGGEGGETATVWESNCKVGPAVGTWEEMDEFVRAFEGFAVGQWNTKRFKWFHRCFAVDLKQFDLQIDEEEKTKRGIVPKADGVKKLLNEIEAWVEIYKIEDVKLGDVGKFHWL